MSISEKKKRILRISLVFIAVIAFIEMGLRIVLQATHDLPIEAYRSLAMDRSALLGFELMPNQRNVFIKRMDTKFSTNSQGFRGTDEYQKKKPGELRVSLVGDSMAFGVGASGDGSTITAQLGSKLNQEYPSRTISVINGGNPSYVSYQVLAHYLVRIQPLKPDFVFIYTGWNDSRFFGGLAESGELRDRAFFAGKSEFFTLSDTWQGYINTFNTHHANHMKNIVSLPVIRSSAVTVFARMAASRWLHRNDREEIQASGTPGVPTTDPVPSAAVEQFEENLRNIASLVKGSKSIPVLMTLASNNSEIATRHQLNQAVHRAATGAAVPIIDLENELNQPDYFHIDKEHFSDTGNQKIASLMQAFILAHSPK